MLTENSKPISLKKVLERQVSYSSATAFSLQPVEVRALRVASDGSCTSTLV